MRRKPDVNRSSRSPRLPATTDRRPCPQLHPQVVVEAMNRVLHRDTVFYCDIGNVTAWCVHYLKPCGPGSFHTDTVYGAMDYAIPAAIGGKRALPDVPVCAIVGDGGALMGSLLDIFTAVEHDIPLAIVVFNDGGWGMLEQGVSASPLRSAPRPSFRFRRALNFAALARALHARGIRVSTESDLERALKACARPRRVTLVDVVIDPTAPAPSGGRIRHVNRHMVQTAQTSSKSPGASHGST